LGVTSETEASNARASMQFVIYSNDYSYLSGAW